MTKIKNTRQENLKYIMITFVVVLAVFAWAREGWRLSDYDSKQQMELAEAGGFSDKTTFLAAQAVGVDNANMWRTLLSEMRQAGFSNPEDFQMARGIDITRPDEWDTFKTAMIKDGFDKPKDYKVYRLTDFKSKKEFYDAKRLGSTNRVQWLGDLADEKFSKIDVGSDYFIAFCANYASGAFKVTQKSRWPRKTDVANILTVVMMFYASNYVNFKPNDLKQSQELGNWMVMGEQSAIAGFESATMNGDGQSTEFKTFKRCMGNIPNVPDQILKRL
jgi:hypothetical protein